MKTVSFDIGDRRIMFVCDSRGTRDGFAHDATLFVDGDRTGEGHCHYLNRTWEHWIYQSVCLKCCEGVIESRKEMIKRQFKADLGVSRICGKNKELLQGEYNSDGMIRLMTETKEILRTKYF